MALQRPIEAFLGKAIDLSNSINNGYFLNLAQHHGYPTPLLDWTKSPFVAAFFAFRKRRFGSGDDPVRIFVFDQAVWPSGPGTNQFTDCGARLEALELAARDNVRVSPQQSVNMFSNLVDIETYLKEWEDKHQKRVLWRIDIPVSEREQAMKELRVMGITSASLFPGLVGICESFTDISF